MNKKAGLQISAEAFVGIVVGILSVVVLFYAAYYVFGGIFNGDWACKDSANDLNLISQYVENYQSGELNGIRSIEGVYLDSRCVLVGFNAGEGSSSTQLNNPDLNQVENVNITRPKQCKGESCICLCAREEISNEENWKGICLNKNNCKTFKEVDSFTSENGNLVLFPQSEEVRGFNTINYKAIKFNLNINYKSNNICLSKEEGVCLNG